jgi:hypothetical protein
MTWETESGTAGDVTRATRSSLVQRRHARTVKKALSASTRPR